MYRERGIKRETEREIDRYDVHIRVLIWPYLYKHGAYEGRPGAPGAHQTRTLGTKFG